MRVVEILKELLALPFVNYALMSVACFALGGGLAWVAAVLLQAVRKRLVRYGKNNLQGAMNLPGVAPLAAGAGVAGVCAGGLLAATLVYVFLFATHLKSPFG